MQIDGQQSVNRGIWFIYNMPRGPGSVVSLVHLRGGPALDPAGTAVIIRSNHQKGSPANDDDSPDQRDYEVRETLCSM